MRHRLDNLHGEHLAVRLVLRLSDFLFLLRFEFLHLVGVALGSGDFLVVAFLDCGSLDFEFRLNKRGQRRKDCTHARSKRGDSTLHRLATVAVKPLHRVGNGTLHPVAFIFFREQTVALLQSEFRLLKSLLDTQFFVRIVAGSGNFAVIDRLKQRQIGIVFGLPFLRIVAEKLLLHRGEFALVLLRFTLAALHLRNEQRLQLLLRLKPLLGAFFIEL